MPDKYQSQGEGKPNTVAFTQVQRIREGCLEDEQKSAR